MINCLPFLPLSFHSVFQLSPFISPLFLNSISTNNNLLFELPFPLISSQPPHHTPYSCPTSSFFNDLISLSFMHPTSSRFLFSSPFFHVWYPCHHLHILHHVSLFIFTGPEYLMDASSTVCYATYGMFLNPFLYSIFFVLHGLKHATLFT